MDKKSTASYTVPNSKAYDCSDDIDIHTITEKSAKLNDIITKIKSIPSTHAIKQKLLDMATSLKTESGIDGADRVDVIKSFISATDVITDAMGWIERGIDDVYLTRIMDMLARENLSAAAMSKANAELEGFYKTGNYVKDNYAAIWQDEFTIGKGEYDMPLYERIESAIERARKKINSGDGNDYIMLKELVSYISGKYDYSGYKNTFGRSSKECVAVVSNINFALLNLAKTDRNDIATKESGKLWLDTLGSKISAHGGQIIKNGE